MKLSDYLVLNVSNILIVKALKLISVIVWKPLTNALKNGTPPSIAQRENMPENRLPKNSLSGHLSMLNPI